MGVRDEGIRAAPFPSSAPKPSAAQSASFQGADSQGADSQGANYQGARPWPGGRPPLHPNTRTARVEPLRIRIPADSVTPQIMSDLKKFARTAAKDGDIDEEMERTQASLRDAEMSTAAWQQRRKRIKFCTALFHCLLMAKT